MDPILNTALESGAPGRPRLLALDLARGLAVVAMMTFHSAWDLTTLNLIETDITEVAGWRWFARTIAASFLFIVGVSLVLAHGRGVRLRPFLRRVGVVAGAAALVTLVTYFVFPDSFIFFGVLHNIALSSLLALPLVGAPAPLAAALAAIVLFAPLFVSGPILDAPLLAFLGLGREAIVTNDFVPIFPWTGFVFAGVAAARFVGRSRWRSAAAAESRGPPVARALRFAGRHSLLVYLLHQPIIFGCLWLVVQLVGANPVAEAAPFMRRCASSCEAASVAPAVCAASCGCTVDDLRQAGLWRPLLAGRESPDELRRAGEIAQLCLAKSR